MLVVDVDLHTVVVDVGVADVAGLTVLDAGAEAAVERQRGVVVTGDDVDEIEAGRVGHGRMMLEPAPSVLYEWELGDRATRWETALHGHAVHGEFDEPRREGRAHRVGPGQGVHEQAVI